jgi:NitT/TauT family transport system permease protein
MNATAATLADPAPSPTARTLFATAATVAGMAVVATLAQRPGVAGSAPLWFWALVVALWIAAWGVNDRLSRLPLPSGRAAQARDIAVPVLFGLTCFYLWEVICRGFGVPSVLMPPPSAILLKLATSQATLWADFRQTFVCSVVPGWLLGSALGFAVALLADRVPFLRRGLLPLGNFVSALPVIGIAPIMVMWFGFDWHSKVAVVVVMTFFPMLVNTVAGLEAAGRLEHDLMRSYAASWGTTLVKLRLPAALPFVFNGLKINSTLALIGAIVAEFFGTPIVGMGFRISTEVGRMQLDMVWAEIVVAAVAGTLFYGLIAMAERAATFWHPSYRRRRAA